MGDRQEALARRAARPFQTWLAARPSVVRLTLLIVLGTVGLSAMALYLPPAVDWRLAYRPAALKLLAGGSPYDVAGYFNPPWALLPLLPVVLLPEAVGRALLAGVAFSVYALVSKKFGARPLTVSVLLLSPPILHSILNGSIDWLAVAGFVMPPQIGLFFVSIKPQVGVAVGAFWLIESWRHGGLRNTLRVFGPFVLVLMISFVVYGLWPLRFEREIGLWWNASLWPMSIPAGLGLLTAAIKKRDIRQAMAASPCLSPYVLLHSWVGVLLALSGSFAYMASSVIGLWLLVVLRALAT